MILIVYPKTKMDTVQNVVLDSKLFRINVYNYNLQFSYILIQIVIFGKQENVLNVLIDPFSENLENVKLLILIVKHIHLQENALLVGPEF